MFRILLGTIVVAMTAMTLGGTPAPVLARSMEADDADAAQRATAAVVNISVWRMRPGVKAGDPPRRVKVYGSGFIVDPTGIIVTNKHVIDGAISITAILSDGNRAPATLVAAAAMTDLAVLKIDMKRPLPA